MRGAGIVVGVMVLCCVVGAACGLVAYSLVTWLIGGR